MKTIAKIVMLFIICSIFFSGLVVVISWTLGVDVDVQAIWSGIKLLAKGVTLGAVLFVGVAFLASLALAIFQW